MTKSIKITLAFCILFLLIVVSFGVGMLSVAQASETKTSDVLVVLEVEDRPEPITPVQEESIPIPAPEVVPEPVVVSNATVVQIENHLGNRPLAQYAGIIAQACDDTGMDPYWFCTISIVESGGGGNCFRSCNAWGYGDLSWSSWEEAIPSFARMFVSEYGSGLTAGSYLRYCPSGAYAPYI